MSHNRATDLHLDKGALDRSLFPHIPDGIEVHKGLRDVHAKFVSRIVFAVRET